jgi:hypothetical protein
LAWIGGSNDTAGIAFSGRQNDEKLHIGKPCKFQLSVSWHLKNLIVRQPKGRTDALWMPDTYGSRVTRPLKNLNIRSPKCWTEALLVLWEEGFMPLEKSFSQRNK